MITESFYVKASRLQECKDFIRTLSSVRFVHNPILEFDEFFIKITLEAEDANKLNVLFNKWYNEDHPKIEKISLLNKIKSIFK